VKTRGNHKERNFMLPFTTSLLSRFSPLRKLFQKPSIPKFSHKKAPLENVMKRFMHETCSTLNPCIERIENIIRKQKHAFLSFRYHLPDR
jgi:hypothetical protein